MSAGVCGHSLRENQGQLLCVEPEDVILPSTAFLDIVGTVGAGLTWGLACAHEIQWLEEIGRPGVSRFLIQCRKTGKERRGVDCFCWNNGIATLHGGEMFSL